MMDPMERARKIRAAQRAVLQPAQEKYARQRKEADILFDGTKKGITAYNKAIQAAADEFAIAIRKAEEAGYEMMRKC
jgi:hypothetical protein